MTRRLVRGAVLAVLLLGGGRPAAAQDIESLRQSLALFYDALTAAPGKDVATMLRQATTPGWVSCGGNDACRPRDDVVLAIGARQREVPDLKWEVKEVVVAGDRVMVRGEASGHPAGEFLGVPARGRAFKVMSIDLHTVENGKLARSYHVEDWLGARRQLSPP